MCLKLLQIDGEITTFLRTFFDIILLSCIYNNSRIVHRIRTALVNKKHGILLSNPADVLFFTIFFSSFKLQ